MAGRATDGEARWLGVDAKGADERTTPETPSSERKPTETGTASSRATEPSGEASGRDTASWIAEDGRMCS